MITNAFSPVKQQTTTFISGGRTKSAQNTPITQFGHQHADGKDCLECKNHTHDHHHQTQPLRQNFFHKLGNWLHQAKETLIKDIKRVFRWLKRLVNKKQSR